MSPGDSVRRATILMELGGIGNHAFIELAGAKLRSEPDPTRENTGREGKASSVQFLKYSFAPRDIARFKTPARRSPSASIIRIMPIWRC